MDEIERFHRETNTPWAEMARRCDLENERYFSNLVRNGGSPNLDIAARAATEFGISLDQACCVTPGSIEAVDTGVLIRTYLQGDQSVTALRRFLPFCDMYHTPKPHDKVLKLDSMGPKSLLTRRLEERRPRGMPEFFIKLITKWLLNTKNGRAAVADYKLAASIGIVVRKVKLNEHLPDEGIKVKEDYLRILLRCDTNQGPRILTFAQPI